MVDRPQLQLESENLAAGISWAVAGAGDAVPIDWSALDGRRVIVYKDDGTAPEPHHEAA